MEVVGMTAAAMAMMIMMIAEMTEKAVNVMSLGDQCSSTLVIIDGNLEENDRPSGTIAKQSVSRLLNGTQTTSFVTSILMEQNSSSSLAQWLLNRLCQLLCERFGLDFFVSPTSRLLSASLLLRFISPPPTLLSRLPLHLVTFSAHSSLDSRMS